MNEQWDNGMGWVPNLSEVMATCKRLPTPFFSDVGPRGPLPNRMFLWEACRSVTGDLLPPRHQGSVGSCVGFGFAAAVDHLACVEIYNGEAEEFQAAAPEMIYAGSRFEVGHGRLGSGDGSIGAWAAEWLNKWGVIPRGKYDTIDLRKYKESQCRHFGYVGVPDSLEPKAKEHPVKSVAMVRTAGEACTALANGYPIAVCSNQGFDARRDNDGFAAPTQRWAHCMAIVGYQKGKRPGFYIVNSWGTSYHTGPTGAGDPSEAGFWADASVVENMLAQNDSWALSGLNGFPARDLVW